MSSASMENKTAYGLAGCLSNVFKLAEVEGLKWVRYTGPNSTTLETPKTDPVLTSYARLLSEGYACSWRRLSPSTDGVSGESKDLWVFYFTTLPDLSGQLAPELQEEATGSWEDGMSTESSSMLFRALNSLIERSLLSENFLPLGKWFARPDPTMGSDGRGCFLCNFSFFIHAHLFICASVDVRAGPALQPLLSAHLCQALQSSSGMQVILSPSGLNAIMTGHSYQLTDPGIEDLIEEWRLFYPRRFELDTSSQLPAAVEVVLGGVRLRYPSQFVFVYHTEDSCPTPPPSPMDEGMMERVIQGGWEETTCVDPLVLQKECDVCPCSDLLSYKDIHTPLNRPNRPHRLMSSSGDSSKSERSSRQHRYRPYSGPTDNATPMREHPTPSSLTLNPSMLNVQRKHLGPPKYTTPLPSPAVTIPSSPAVKFPNPGICHFPAPPTTHLQPQTTPPVSNNTAVVSMYDLSRVADIVAESTAEKERVSSHYNNHEDGWWHCMHLPEAQQSLQRLVTPISPWATGFTLPGFSHALPGSPTANGMFGPGNKKSGASPVRRVRSNQSFTDHQIMTTPELTSPSKRRPSTTGKGNKGSRSRARRDSEVVAPPTILDPQPTFREESLDVMFDHASAEKNHAHIIVHQDTMEGIENTVTSGDTLGLAGQPSLRPSGTGGMVGIDLTSENAVKISGDLGSLFDDSEEEEDLTKTTPAGDMNHFQYTDVSGTMTDFKQHTNIGSSKTSKLLPGNIDQLHPPMDFSRIYPTPPSVESTDEKFEEAKSMMGIGMNINEDRSETFEIGLMMKLSPFEDVMTGLVPDEFRPLLGLSSLTSLSSQMRHVVHAKVPQSASLANSHADKSSTTQSCSSGSAKSEPQKFIFPPPSSLINRNMLTLPLTTKEHTKSPLISTPFTALSSPLRPLGRLPRHFSSVAQTPLDSPFDPITPTPMSCSRLTPVLPEAHALYISLALLDSALAANVSDNVDIDLSAFQNFMIKQKKRIQLDSVGSAAGMGSLGAVGEGDSLFELGEEKPLMMAGIADYPSLGFKEDIMVTTPAPGTPWSSTSNNATYSNMGLSCLSEEEATSGTTQVFLSIVQDYCLHLCLTGRQEASQISSSAMASTPGAFQPYQQNQENKQQSKHKCRLYHTHSVTSAILCGKQLIVSGRPLQPRLPPSSAASMKQLSSPVTLDKEDNSAAWILDLLSLPTKFVTKKLRELRSVFQSSFHHAPCIKVSTKGPLSLKDLQTLTPSQTPIGDECVPLPMQPLVVGCEREWLSISPMTLSSWDKLLVEPYSSHKDILYLVVCPGGDTIMDTLQNFFRNISIIYKNCKLGLHLPLDKGSWEGGIVTGLSNKPPDKNEETDEKPNKSDKKEVPSSLPLTSFEKICNEMIGPYLHKLPKKRDDLLASTTVDVPAIHRNSPVFVVVYVVMRDGEGGRSRGGRQRQTKTHKRDEVVEVLRAISSILSSEDLPEDTKNRILIQPLEESELVGPQANNSHHLRSLAFSVFSRCSPVIQLNNDAHHLTDFGPSIERPKPTIPIRLYSPLYILSPEPPLPTLSLVSAISSTQQQSSSSILFAPDECTLFCSYCVSADKHWLLAVVCDRQAELLDTCVIGLQPNDVDGSGSGDRYQALQKLWAYLFSILATSVLKWNLVITRLGKPSSAEIREWSRIIYNDGLMTTNQLLKSDCEYCAHTIYCPYLRNVIIVSVQPERNIQLFPTNDPGPSISHIFVLPPHPNALPAMTPTDDPQIDFLTDFGDPGGEGDQLVAGIEAIEDVFSGLNKIDLDFQTTNYGTTPGGEDARAPLATGYLISTTPPGHLPSEFWGHDKPQTVCNMFKTLLHCHLTVETYPSSPPDVLCSVLLSFDALSWLSINHVTQQRNSSLPIHLFLLSKLYNFFTILSNSR